MAEAIDIFYGIGAAKSGTSWLHDYYMSHPECHIRSLKELFWFCRKPGADDAHARDFRAHLVRAVQMPVVADGPGGEADCAIKRARQARALLEWFDYLDRPGATDADYLAYVTLRMDRKPNAWLCADITPKYALLDTAGFEKMARLAKKPRFVFLMRDPVERLWSHCRMLSKVAEKRQGRVVAPEFYAKSFLEGDLKNAGEVGVYSDYSGTLTRLKAAVSAENIYTGFYETLTEDASVQELNSFLGLSHVAPKAGRRVNTGRGGELEEQLRVALSRKLAPQYDFVADLTAGDLPAIWQENARRAV